MFTWDPHPCAERYNVYSYRAVRFSDANADGLADDYGGCFAGNLNSALVTDSQVPPAGVVQFYTVSAENFSGEGTLGFSSALGTRLPSMHCP
jgi:hypothetical protein